MNCKKQMPVDEATFDQCLEIIIKCDDPDTCLHITDTLTKQCDAWYFCVRYKERKAAGKGLVLRRSLIINQMAVAADITIFKEAIRRLCAFFSASYEGVTFADKGSIPVFVLPVIEP